MNKNNPLIYIDKRELRSQVAKELERLGAELRFETLEIGDYIASDSLAFERKTSEDFLTSWVTEKKIFNQLYDLKMSYTTGILLIEGCETDLFTMRKIHPNAVQSCLYTIARMGIPFLFTLNPRGTAESLFWYAAREQNDEKREFYPHGKRSSLSPDQQLEYFLSAIPDIGVVRARFLLKHFGNIHAIVNASAEELSTVLLCGEFTVQRLLEFFNREYKGDSKKHNHIER